MSYATAERKTNARCRIKLMFKQAEPLMWHKKYQNVCVFYAYAYVTSYVLKIFIFIFIFIFLYLFLFRFLFLFWFLFLFIFLLLFLFIFMFTIHIHIHIHIYIHIFIYIYICSTFVIYQVSKFDFFCFLIGQIPITCRSAKRYVHCLAIVRGQHEICLPINNKTESMACICEYASCLKSVYCGMEQSFFCFAHCFFVSSVKFGIWQSTYLLKLREFASGNNGSFSATNHDVSLVVVGKLQFVKVLWTFSYSLPNFLETGTQSVH